MGSNKDDKGNDKPKKVIVIRHGCDFPKNKLADTGKDGNGFTAYLPSESGNKYISYPIQALSDFGCRQAMALSIALPKFIKHNEFAPITKVNIQDPSPIRPNYETSNPFRTVFNFIHNCQIKNVSFTNVKNDVRTNIPIDTPSDGSLLLCYTSQIINGDNKQPNKPEKDSILERLGTKFKVPNKDSIKGPPLKGYTIYVFGEGEVKYYHLDVDSKSIKEKGFVNNPGCP